MNRDQWTPRQLRRFVAPSGVRSGYPNLCARVRLELPETIRARIPKMQGCCWRPWQLAKWAPESPVFAVIARLCEYMSGIKYPDLYPIADGLRMEIHYYAPTEGDPIDLTRTLEVIHALQALGVRVDVLGWRRRKHARS